MKHLRLIAAAVAVLAGSASIHAQDARAEKYREDARAEIMANPLKAAGGYYIREFGKGPLAPAPKGYKPVYISYYARHGARFASGSDPYGTTQAILDKAHMDGNLTPLGEEFRDYFLRVMEKADGRDGDLSPYGFKQVRGIAKTMYGRFPEVFKGDTRASALATCVPRVMLTMTSFLDELKSCDPDLDITMDASERYVDWLIPFDGTRKEIIRESSTSPRADAAKKAMEDEYDMSVPLSRIFKDTGWIERQGFSLGKAESAIWKVCASAQCLEDTEGGEFFTRIWTPEELFARWEADILGFYYYWGHCPTTEHRGTLGAVDIVERAIIDTDADLSRLGTPQEVNLRLKFSHDTGIAPLLSFLEVNSMGAVIDDPSEIKNFFQDYKVAMGSNFQFVFYRSKRNPDIIFRLLYNGDEASLPLPEVADGFYRWADFKAYYGPLVEAGQKRLEELADNLDSAK